MPKPFVKLSVDEFEELVDSFTFTRAIDAVHMHHTWQPNHGQYRGLPMINAMWKYHTQTNGWSDIAQHISIAPDGSIWTGRSWNQPPASAAGYNGNSRKGPFMFEMIGDCTINRMVTIGRPGSTPPPDAVRRQVHADRELNEANAAFRASLGAGARAAKKKHKLARTVNPYADAVDVLFSAALPHQFAHELGGAGVFTRTAMRVLGGQNGELTNGGFANRVKEAFPGEFRSVQQPEIYCSKASEANLFLGKLG